MGNRYFKQIENGYILSVGTGAGWTEIDENEYSTILEALRQIPSEAGKQYKLTVNLTWEEFDIPEDEDPEISAEDIQSALEAVL